MTLTLSYSEYFPWVVWNPLIFYSIKDKYSECDTNHCSFCNNPDVKYHIHSDSVSHTIIVEIIRALILMT